MTKETYNVLLFESVSAVLVAEKILKGKGIMHKLIPVPKHLSSDCGVCIRINADDLSQVKKTVEGKVKVLAIQGLSSVY
jgi:hypothetical protein